MVITLQRYVARELVKTFALTAIGLTLTFSLCGGVLNMIQAEVLTAVQLARMLGFVLPIALTLTLPISALFACAIVYGRLAADNEFDACRASGINIHHLLAPAFGLSIATAAFTYTFTNHLIPRFIEQLDKMVRSDIQKVVYQALSTRGHLRYRLKSQVYVLYADQTYLYDENADVKTIQIERAAFLEMEEGRLARCGTADQARVDFIPTTAGGAPIVQASLSNIRSFDVRRNQFFDFASQPFDPMQIPQDIELEPKWLTLPQLLYYREHPLELHSIRDQLAKLRALVRRAQFYKYAYDQLTGPDKVLRLADEHVRYEIQAERVDRDEYPDTLRPKLRKVTVKETFEGGWRKQTADTCTIDVTQSGFGAGPNIVIPSLRGNVTTTDSVDPTTPVERMKRDLEKVELPETLPGMPDVLDEKTLLGELSDPSAIEQKLPSLQLGDRVDDARESDRGDVFKLGQEIVGIIHSRLAFSASSLVILVLAAALGVIFRGGQLLTAFVIAFVPGLLVVVMNIMGRQLTENTGTHLIGIIVIWAAIAIFTAADAVVVGKYLKR